MSEINFKIKKTLKYYLFSRHKKGHAIHSPFVFNLIIEVFRDRKKYPEYETIEKIIKKLRQNHQTIQFQTFGTKNQLLNNKISKIAKSSSVGKKYGRLLFRMVRYFKLQNILELGTCVGVSSLYLAHANKKANVITIEASETLAKIAQKNFDEAQLSNISILHKTFEEALPEILKNNPPFNLIFFDGNHTFDATLNYFYQCLEYKNEHSIFIFDDIYWSEGMYKAWNEIRQHPEVMLSIDLHRMGFIFFKKDFLAKQHFAIRF